jgi:hypothetical protein
VLVTTEFNAGTNGDLVAISVANRKPTPFLKSPASEMLARFSPDGRWVAYQSQEVVASAASDVFIRSFPDGGGLRQVSSGNGFLPTWTKGGRELVYGADAGPLTAVMAVEVTPAAGALTMGRPQKLFELPIAKPVQAAFLDASADGTRFAVLLLTTEQAPQPLRHARIVFNFLN